MRYLKALSSVPGIKHTTNVSYNYYSGFGNNNSSATGWMVLHLRIIVTESVTQTGVRPL